MHEFGVLIGRFQPFHNGHLATVRVALKTAHKLIIVLGGHNRAQDVRNPWTSAQRMNMIRDSLSIEENKRVQFVMANDYDYNNLLWVTAIQEAVHEATDGASDVVLIGHKKDASSFYLKLFPQWGDHIDTGLSLPVDATKVRDLMFTQDKIGIKDMVPPIVYSSIVTYMGSPEFQRLHDEYQEILEDKASWLGAPYRPTFVTVDAIVICSGHVLVVRRRGRYGKGLIALPGGYVNAGEALIDSCIRELKEETGIKLDAKLLKDKVVDKDVFDKPDRDLRGRVITHAFCIKLPDGELPRVKGMDDADKAWFMSLREIGTSEPKFFADHFHIINRFCARY
jgi:bifunctional NMN adenylyltransferase/nudix hydrolase